MYKLDSDIDSNLSYVAVSKTTKNEGLLMADTFLRIDSHTGSLQPYSLARPIGFKVQPPATVSYS